MGMTQVPPSLLANSGYELGMRNRIINGAMGIWQRGTSFSVAANIPVTYTADRWYHRTAVCTGSVTQQVPTTFTKYQYSTRVQRPSGQPAGTLFLAQPFETNNIRDVVGGAATITFVAKCGANYSSTSNTLYVNVYFGTGTERSRGAAVFTSETASYNSVTLTTGETLYTVSVANVPAGTTQMELSFEASFTGTAGTNDWFEITGVQLEKGATATPFEYRPYGQELALCQRYCWNMNYQGTNAYVRFGTGYAGSTTSSCNLVFAPVPMRLVPSLTWSGNFAEVFSSGGGATGSAVTIGDGSTISSFQLNFAFSAGSIGASATTGVRINNSLTWYAIFSAEL